MTNEQAAQVETMADDSARHRTGRGLLLVLVLMLTLFTLWLTVRNIVLSQDLGSDPLTPLRHLYWLVYSDALLPLVSSPLLYIGLPVLLLMQAMLPAVRQDRVFSKGLIQDLGWMLIHGVMVGTFIWAFLDTTHHLLAPWTAPLKLGLLSHVPAWVEIIIGYLLIELLAWFSHMLRHKLKVLWVFHEVHHSQPEMNPFTLFRIHPVDYLMSEAIILLPSVFFNETLGIVLAYLSISRLHDALNHSNIKTNLGWLRFVFVTPQSHRVHHSAEPAYFDMNYGVTLCIWDRLFGTHARDFVYPRTGIPDQNFPLETQRPAARLPGALLAQLVYPFVKVMRKFGVPLIESGQRAQSGE